MKKGCGTKAGTPLVAVSDLQIARIFWVGLSALGKVKRKKTWNARVAIARHMTGQVSHERDPRDHACIALSVNQRAVPLCALVPGSLHEAMQGEGGAVCYTILLDALLHLSANSSSASANSIRTW